MNPTQPLDRFGLQFLLEEVSHPFQIMTREGILIYVNLAWCRLLGYDLEEIQQRSFWEVVEPKALERCQRLLGSLNAVNSLCKLGITLVARDDRRVELEGKVHARFSASATNLEELWILWQPNLQPATEIEFRKVELQNCQVQLQQAHYELIQCQLIEQQLWDSETRFQHLTAHLPGVIYRFERSSQGLRRFTYISPGSIDLYELPPEAIVENPVLAWQLIHPEDIRSLRQTVQFSEQTLENWFWEGRIVTRSGQTKWVQGRARPEAQTDGGIVWDGLLIDITDRKQAELELQASEARFRVIFDQAAVGMNRVSLEGYFLQANQRFCQMVGYTETELMELTVKDVTYPEDWLRHQPLMEKLAQGELAFYTLEKRLVHRNGNVQWIDLAASLVCDSNGTPLFDIGIVQDISERKRAEIEIVKALEKERELNQLKSRFISIVSHEFRTPLTTIVSSADILENFELAPIERSKFLQQIINAAYHMNSLLSDMAFLNKSETDTLPVHPSSIDLKRLGEKIVRELSFSFPQNPLLFKTNCPDCVIRVDEKLIRQILSNLISNAAKYSPEGRVVEISLTQECDRVLLQVQDQGRGIPLEDQPHIFEFFHRARNTGTVQGTGLGLAIVKHCVNLCGGEITFTSKEGEGSIFTVILYQ